MLRMSSPSCLDLRRGIGVGVNGVPGSDAIVAQLFNYEARLLRNSTSSLYGNYCAAFCEPIRRHWTLIQSRKKAIKNCSVYFPGRPPVWGSRVFLMLGVLPSISR